MTHVEKSSQGNGFTHSPHPWHKTRKEVGPVLAAEQLSRQGFFARVNAAIGLRVTVAVGTMWCAYAFFGLAIYGLPQAIHQGPSAIVLWISSEFLQLVLLPIIIVGQNLQARAADKRAEQTYLDTEAILHELHEVHRHIDHLDAKTTGTPPAGDESGGDDQ